MPVAGGARRRLPFPLMQSPMTLARRHLLPFWFLAPALLIELAIIFYPVLQTAWMSLHDYVLFRPSNAPFIGLGNFVRAANDPVFWLSLGNSLVWIVGVIAVQFLLGLGTALLLNQSFWWRSAARALVVIPWALPSVIIAHVDVDVRLQSRHHQRHAAARRAHRRGPSPGWPGSTRRCQPSCWR